MEFENLLTLIKTVSDSELTDFDYEENGTRIRLKKKKETVVVSGFSAPISFSVLLVVSRRRKRYRFQIRKGLPNTCHFGVRYTAGSDFIYDCNYSRSIFF